MYDYLYETQEIFDFYNIQNNKNSFISRNEELPFSSCLFYFDNINLNKNDIDILKKIRFYSFTYRDFDFLNMSFNYIINFVYNCTKYFNEFFNQSKNNTNKNSVIILLELIYISICYFCILTFIEIVQNKEQSFLYLDNFIKRYKSYVDAAILINKKMENYNVIINLLYDKYCNINNKKIFPKFSIYRLMMILYYRIIINPLLDEKFNKNIYKIIVKLYKIYYKEELRKKIFDDNSSLMMLIQKNSTSLKLERNESTDFNSYDDLVNCLYNIINFDSIDLMDIDIEFNISQIFNEFNKILLDFICDEYSVYYINSSFFPVLGNYLKLQNYFQEEMKNIIIQAMSKQINKNFDFLSFIQNESFINDQLINVSRISFLNYLGQILLNFYNKQFIENLKISFNNIKVINNLESKNEFQNNLIKCE